MSIWKKVKFFLLLNLHYLLGPALFVLGLLSAINEVFVVGFITWMLMIVWYPASDFYTNVIREHERELGLYDHESAVKVI